MSRRGNSEGQRVRLTCENCGRSFVHVVTRGGRYPKHCSSTCKLEALYKRRGRKGW